MDFSREIFLFFKKTLHQTICFVFFPRVWYNKSKLAKGGLQMGKLCIFTGHRILPGDLLPLRQALRRRIRQLAQEGYTRFASGGAMGFDLLAAEIVLELRETIPELELQMILPCKGQDRAYSVGDRARYRDILSAANSVRYTAEEYYEGCMLTRDRVLAAAADACICYLTHSQGGTAYTVRHVLLRDIPLYNLAEEL